MSRSKSIIRTVRVSFQLSTPYQRDVDSAYGDGSADLSLPAEMFVKGAKSMFGDLAEIAWKQAVEAFLGEVNTVAPWWHDSNLVVKVNVEVQCFYGTYRWTEDNVTSEGRWEMLGLDDGCKHFISTMLQLYHVASIGSAQKRASLEAEGDQSSE